MDLRYTYDERPYLSMGYKEYIDRKEYFDENSGYFGDVMPVCINCEVEAFGQQRLY